MLILFSDEAVKILPACDVIKRVVDIHGPVILKTNS
jgi:hypothetical protein